MIVDMEEGDAGIRESHAPAAPIALPLLAAGRPAAPPLPLPAVREKTKLVTHHKRSRTGAAWHKYNPEHKHRVFCGRLPLPIALIVAVASAIMTTIPLPLPVPFPITITIAVAPVIAIIPPPAVTVTITLAVPAGAPAALAIPVLGLMTKRSQGVRVMGEFAWPK
jgi:hypothetical protein